MQTALPKLTGEVSGDLAATLRCLLQLFEGPAGLARQMKLDFDANEEGSANRIKVELAMLNMMEHLSGEDDEAVDDEDLENLAKSLA